MCFGVPKIKMRAFFIANPGPPETVCSHRCEHNSRQLILIVHGKSKALGGPDGMLFLGKGTSVQRRPSWPL